MNEKYKAALSAIESDGMSFLDLDESLRKDPQLVIAAFNNIDKKEEKKWHKDLISIIKKMDPELRKDINVMTVVVDMYPNSFKHADPILFKDLEFAMFAITKDIKNFDYIDKSLKENPEFMKKATELAKKNIKGTYWTDLPKIFKDLPEEFRINRDIVIEAAYWNIKTLKHVSSELCNDSKTMYPIIDHRPKAIEYVTDEKVKTKLEIIYKINHFKGHRLNFNWFIKNDVPQEFRSDKDVMTPAVSLYPPTFRYASEDLKKDKDFTIHAIHATRCYRASDEMSYRYYNHLSFSEYKIMRDKLAAEMTDLSFKALINLPSDSFNDREVITYMALVLKDLNKKNEYREITFDDAINMLPNDIINNKEFAEELIFYVPKSIQYIRPDPVNDIIKMSLKDNIEHSTRNKTIDAANLLDKEKSFIGSSMLESEDLLVPDNNTDSNSHSR